MLPEPCGPDCRGMSPYHEEPCPKCGRWTERRVKVVAAIMIRQGRILLQQRDPKRDYPLSWECPGGKVELKDQSYRHALIRELGEELGWQTELPYSGMIDLHPCFGTVFAQPEVLKPFVLSFYLVNPSDDWHPKMLDAVGMGWFTLREMANLPLTPGNIRLYDYIVTLGLERMLKI